LFVVCYFEKRRFSTKPYQTAKTSEGRGKERKIDREIQRERERE